ncbi:MAG: response regulator [Verrucomicrobiia bacterium]|jgi:CheY-like chemotaxis protein
MGIFSAAIALFSSGGVGEPKSTILVIDDDLVLLQTVKSLLGKRGFNVVTSSSGQQGLDMLRNAARDIRVVVLDYRMPELNGGETLKVIKQLSPNAKVIGLTAVDLDSVPEAYLDEVDKLLTKPVIATQLIGAIDEFLAEKQTASAVIES